MLLISFSEIHDLHVEDEMLCEINFSHWTSQWPFCKVLRLTYLGYIYSLAKSYFFFKLFLILTIFTFLIRVIRY